MANLIATGTGSFTAAASWQTVDSTSELDSEAGSTAVSTATLDSATFTPGTITVDGIAVKLAARASTPSGTFTVTLRNNTSSLNVDSVTVNVSDLPASGLGWVFFKFSSSHVLLGATLYDVRVVCSTTGSQVTLFTNGTANNWSRKIRTTTTQAPAAGNQLVICNELTGAGTKNTVSLIMDNTATTSFGPTVSGGPPQGMMISNGATLTLGTSASTAYFLKCKGIVQVCGGGTFQCAQSGTRLPASSSFTLFADSVAGGDSGVVVGVGGTFNAYGATKTPWTLLSVDAATSISTFTTSTSTGWNVGDTIIITPTSRTATQFDKLVLSGTSGTGTCTTSTTSTTSHSGTVPTQAEVLNVTRNIILTGASSILTGYISFDTSAVGVLSYCEVTNYGINASTKNGISAATTTGSLLVQGCGIHDLTVSGAAAFIVSNTNVNNFTFDNNASFNISGNPSGGTIFINALLTNTSWAVTNNAMCVASGCRNFQFGSLLGTITGNTASGNNGNDGFFWAANTTNTAITTGNLILNISSNTAHATANGFKDNSATFIGITFGPMISWRNQNGIVFTGNNSDVVINSSTSFGNSTVDLQVGTGAQRLTFNNLFSSCDTNFGANTFMNVGNGASNIIFNNCTIDTNTSIFIPHTFLIVNGGTGCTLLFNNCSVGPSNALPGGLQLGGYIGNPSSFGYRNSSIAFQNFNGTTTDHRYYTPIFTIQADNVIFGSAAPSERLTPFSTTLKSWSAPHQITVSSGGSHVVSVALRASAAADAGGVAYSGNNPRLVQRANPSIGLASDTPLATFTLATGTWGTITGTTGTATALGIQEFYIDADGTSSAWINIDDWNII